MWKCWCSTKLLIFTFDFLGFNRPRDPTWFWPLLHFASKLHSSESIGKLPVWKLVYMLVITADYLFIRGKMLVGVIEVWATESTCDNLRSVYQFLVNSNTVAIEFLLTFCCVRDRCVFRHLLIKRFFCYTISANSTEQNIAFMSEVDAFLVIIDVLWIVHTVVTEKLK